MIYIHNPTAKGASLPPLTEFRHIILVEGVDDAAVVELLLDGRVDKALIYVAGGEDNFKRVISLLKDLRDFPAIRTMTIVRDANGDPRGKITSCKAILDSQDLSVPDEPLLLTGAKLRTGIVLMPPTGEGSVESVLLDAYPAVEHPAHARAFIAALDNDDPEAQAWTQGQSAKRLLRALLAVGSKRLGIKLNSIVPNAVSAGLWRAEHASLEVYRSYFSSLDAAGE